MQSEARLQSVSAEKEKISAENETLLQMLEQSESKMTTFTQREAQVDSLALECRRAKEQAVLERDRLIVREQQLLKRIQTLEADRSPSQEQERHK